jgi:hypothetical protein
MEMETQMPLQLPHGGQVIYGGGSLEALQLASVF